MEFKQVILVRADLKLPKGKMSAQAAHAAVDAVLKAEKEVVTTWKEAGMKKVVLKVKDDKGQEQFFDCIVCNPPYLSEPELQKTLPEIKDYEPRSALYGGSDGLSCYGDLLKHADTLLHKGGFLLLEIGSEQAYSLTDMIQKTAHYSEITTVQDLAGFDRVVSARK